MSVAAARQVNQITAAPLGDIVALTLRAARAKKDAQAKKKKEQGKEGGADTKTEVCPPAVPTVL